MISQQKRFAVALGDDPCATLLRANLKELVIATLIEKFTLPSSFEHLACLRLFGSTLIRASASSFPFADRKSEDLDIEVHLNPQTTSVENNVLYKTALCSVIKLLREQGIKVESYEGESVETLIDRCTNGDHLDTARLKLSFTFDDIMLTLLCGKHASSAKTTTAYLETNISPPHQITVLLPPKAYIDQKTVSHNPFFKFDNVLHYLSKVIVRSSIASDQFIPNLREPTTFRPTDIMNIFNICFAISPPLVNFRLPLNAHSQRAPLILTNDELLFLRILAIANFAVVGKSANTVEQIDFNKFTPTDDAVQFFRSSLAPTIGRADVLDDVKLKVMLLSFKRLLQELFPSFAPKSRHTEQSHPFLFSEERQFLNEARGSIHDGVTTNLTLLYPLFAGRAERLIKNTLPHLRDALHNSTAIKERADKFFELSQLSF